MQPQAERVTRAAVPALDELLGVALPVLDDGFVRVIDYMGDDRAVVQAARVSYGDGTKQVSEDRGLIRYLLRHRHTTPFEMCELKLHVRVPMDAWRQWIRHRSASVNEVSSRYSIVTDSAQRTAPEAWRRQADDNRQGSSGCFDAAQGAAFTAGEREVHALARRVYEEKIARGVAREQARKDLPLCTYTEAYWKIDLHNLLHFLSLRMDPHAQQEIRAYATVIGERIVARWVPLVWEAFVDYRLGAASLSRIEQEILGAIGAGDAERACALASAAGWLERGAVGLKRHRERAEFEAKLAGWGVAAPWAADSR
ncbi:MAG: FAD-dependent thymidylate synthase [bacterium]|nr:FAD-dependent thymidylate synthase [bacterium]